MPKISLKKHYLESLAGVSWGLKKWEEEFALVKGEVNDYDSNTDEFKIELADSNRPDLWCCEGIARQIKCKLEGKPGAYSFFSDNEQDTCGEVIVSAELEKIRPYIATCTVRNLSINEEVLLQLIQAQEKLSENYGKKRENVSIGVYCLNKIEFPVHYKTANPGDVTFIPLGFDASMTLAEIVELHPKGMQYGHILKGDQYPVLIDNKNEVLSFPPIINSKSIGEVKRGEKDIFIEVTGTDMRQVMLVLNIFAVNMADLGGEIGINKIIYNYDTPCGREVLTPMDIAYNVRVEKNKVEHALGILLEEGELEGHLKSYGYSVKETDEHSVSVKFPAYRDDIMADVDLIEDFAISRGYNSFNPVMPVDYTVGSLLPIELLIDKIREYIIGFGFQEIISNILCSKASMTTNMREEDAKLVEVENVMSLSYAVLRSSIIPSLLQVEQCSSKAFYPHKIFEAGDVAVLDSSENLESKTLKKMAALIAHAGSNFSEIHSCLDLLMYYLKLEYHLKPISHSSYIDGRVGAIIVNNKEIGFIGELHPEVLNNWDISVPCVAFELTVEDIL